MTRLDKIGIASFGITLILGWIASGYFFYLLFSNWAILAIVAFTVLIVIGFNAHNEEIKTQALKK